MKKTKNPPPNDIYKMIHFRDASGENNEHGLILFISSGPALTLRRNVLGSICREKKKNGFLKFKGQEKSLGTIKRER